MTTTMIKSQPIDRVRRVDATRVRVCGVRWVQTMTNAAFMAAFTGSPRDELRVDWPRSYRKASYRKAGGALDALNQFPVDVLGIAFEYLGVAPPPPPPPRCICMTCQMKVFQFQFPRRERRQVWQSPEPIHHLQPELFPSPAVRRRIVTMEIGRRADNEAGPEAEPEAEPEPDAEAEPEPDAEAEPEPEPEPEAEPDGRCNGRAGKRFKL